MIIQLRLYYMRLSIFIDRLQRWNFMLRFIFMFEHNVFNAKFNKVKYSIFEVN